MPVPKTVSEQNKDERDLKLSIKLKLLSTEAVHVFFS